MDNLTVDNHLAYALDFANVAMHCLEDARAALAANFTTTATDAILDTIDQFNTATFELLEAMRALHVNPVNTEA